VRLVRLIPLVAVLTLLAPIAVGVTIATGVQIIPETGMTWTVQSTLNVDNLTLSDTTLGISGIGLSIDRDGNTLTGKIYRWSASNITLALDGSKTYTATVSGLTVGQIYHLYRDGTHVGTYQPTTSTVTLAFQTGSEHVFQFGTTLIGGTTPPGSGGPPTEPPQSKKADTLKPKVNVDKARALIIVVGLLVALPILFREVRKQRHPKRKKIAGMWTAPIAKRRRSL